MGVAIKRLAAAVPGGVALDPVAWEPRHRWIVRLLWLHIPIVAALSLHTGDGVVHAFAETVPLAMLAVLATRSWNTQRARSILASLGLMTSSAMLVHIVGGVTEMHFHFFVMLGVISLYHEWRPLLISLAFVLAHHAVMGTMFPTIVFADEAAREDPIRWGAIHAFAVLGSCAVSILSWRIVEDSNERAQGEIERTDRRFRALIENAADIVSVIDVDGIIRYESPAIEKTLGYAPSERVGTRASSYMHPDDLEHLERAEALGQRAIGRRGDFRLRHRQGHYVWVEVTTTNLLDDPEVAGFVANFREVTERRVLEEELVHQAFHDALTGLANRALLLDRLDHALDAARARGTRLAVLYLDLDDFKIVNDGLGHSAGDQILRVTAQRVAGALQPEDTAARLGGDEFAVLVEGLGDPADAYVLGAKLLEAVCSPIVVDGVSVNVHASLGIVVSDGSDDAASVLRNADLAMYRAKGDGKGRFEVYEVGMHAAVVERMMRKTDLQRGVDAGEFVPHYQPIVDLTTGQVTGVEALARWEHPTRGLVPPSDFIPLAEESGLIVQIGSAILRQACADAARWARSMPDEAPQTMSVNLSTRQLQDPFIVDEVRAALLVTNLPPSRLTLEVTESMLLQDADAAASTLDALKALGVRIALDDFGTGYSSLSYLDRFPVDVVKIDKSFIDSLADEASTPSPLVAAIVNLGTMLGLDVTAEGIEDATQVARLREMSCVSGQGFLFARPMSAGQLEQHLTKRVGETACV